MPLSDHLEQLTNATATRDGDAGVEALEAIEAEYGPVVAAVITADLLAHVARQASERPAPES
ncbi:hypothetical protein Caci_2877 [Catenulispora acidiphila DSM 44928]|uniref:Uncharacterized protein n=1 Tax=Catenulispora acidiphila (strain DSM 44928 / JCM 14897 / NBRC 102108 / NRRL B-24433 / ID139908) TaxID=479433 RepID=C7Q2P4_CATAD|nr:hypothetical protein [Catenulispora acidiphila]ACU71786.1 hypothetical protein Caci_2877 [Catenulispora acidiphila DSM 44928]